MIHTINSFIIKQTDSFTKIIYSLYAQKLLTNIQNSCGENVKSDSNNKHTLDSHRYANSWTAKSRTSHLVDWTSHGLNRSQTSH